MSETLSRLKPRTVNPARYPYSVELQYARILRRLVSDIEELALVEIKIDGPAIIEAADRDYGRKDAITYLVPFASGFVSRLTALIDRVLNGVTSSLLSALDRVQEIRSNANNAHRKEWSRQLREAYGRELGVNILNNEPDLSRMLNAWEQQNIELIKSLPQTITQQLQSAFTSAFVDGTNMKDLSKIVQERAGVGKSRADLIARDQIGKLNGQLSLMRQRAAGIESYVWRTMGDERVRAKHRLRNGKTYRWDNPNEIKPGQEIRCRCIANPVFPGVQDIINSNNIGELQE